MPNIYMCNMEGVDGTGLEHVKVMDFVAQPHVLRDMLYFDAERIDNTVAGLTPGAPVMFNIEPAKDTDRKWFYHEYYKEWGNEQRRLLG